MLTEMKLEDMPMSDRDIRRTTPLGKFSDKTMEEFAKSDMKIAEVNGWPDGEPLTRKDVAKCAGYLRSRTSKYKDQGIKVTQRGLRIFLMKDTED